MKIILGSSSPRRKELLSKIVKEFEIIPSLFDESNIKQEEKNPAKLVELLSKLKGEEIYSRIEKNEDLILISSDTMVFFKNQLLGKPKDKEDAFKMLKKLQNNKHEVYTGLYILIKQKEKTKEILTHSKTDVYFRKVTDEEIMEYINSENTLDKAGSYAIQGKAKEFVEKIDGNIETVIGLDVKKLATILKEFKEFIAKGNVMDLAVGVIIGGAFGKIVTSIVDDILMPLIGMLIGGIDFTGLVWKIGEAEVKYGNFIQNVIDFLIVAFCIFIIIKLINRASKRMEKLRKKEEEEVKEETPAKSDEVVLLEEIRDLLKK